MLLPIGLLATSFPLIGSFLGAINCHKIPKLMLFFITTQQLGKLTRSVVMDILIKNNVIFAL
jgi:hypothetical protein